MSKKLKLKKLQKAIKKLKLHFSQLEKKVESSREKDHPLEDADFSKKKKDDEEEKDLPF